MSRRSRDDGVDSVNLPGPDYQPGNDQRLDDLALARAVGEQPPAGAELEPGQVRR
jgi:hypothetical protein